MLESILVKNVATYDDQGVQISGLKKVNFIYGANGSGKTTLTKFINDPEHMVFSNSSLVWKNAAPIKALVYNKEFREKNFGKGNINGVFTLGQATKEDIAAIQTMQENLAVVKEKGIKEKRSLDSLIQEKQKLENDFRDVVWISVYKKYEVEFKDAFVGVQRKEIFKAKLLDGFESNEVPLEDYNGLIEKAKTIFGEVPVLISPISSISYQRLEEIETDDIWKRKVIGRPDVQIAALIQTLNLNDWVNEGRAHLSDDETCPFCQQKTITKNFREQLENYFDETFTNDIKVINNNSEEYNRLMQNMLNVLQGIEATEKANINSKLDVDKFTSYLKTLSSQATSNKELLNGKIKEPSRSIQILFVKQQLDDIASLIIEANDKIANHNKIVSNYAIEKELLIKKIWKFIGNGYKAEIDDFNKKIKGLNSGITNLEKKCQDLRVDYSKLDNQIKAANKNVTSVQPSVDEINKVLKLYGFSNFSIVPSNTTSNQYQILRNDGTIAESTLSEGEVTFITFLYFLQLAKGSVSQELITEERILVIDDPISSLDSNVLFVVSSLLKEIIKSIKQSSGSIRQLILLTHNVYFHKEVSFIDGKNSENGDTFFWILRRIDNVSTIQAFERANPIQSSYELLWKEIKNKENISGITIQNTMRRIIENYFKILGKFRDDDLITKFETAQEQEICRSLICWINDGSHGIPDDLFIEHQNDVIDRYFEVFKNIFYTMGHSEHYNMMMREAV